MITYRNARRPLLGAHMSIAGGLYHAVERGAELGCTTIQIFTTNPSQWKESLTSAPDIEKFSRALRRSGIGPVFSHGGYLLNLASPKKGLRDRSTQALIQEVKRSGMLGITFVVIHPGSHGGDGEEAGIDRASDTLQNVLDKTAHSAVGIALENTAGQGHSLGYRFEHLSVIIDRVGSHRLGVCFDTAHAHAAGYDLGTAGSYRRTMSALDEAVGLERVMAIHVNDCLKPLGSRVDRHDHIGRGFVGLEAFGRLMRDEAFGGVPKVLETPKYRGDTFMDPINLAVLRKLAGIQGRRMT